MKPIKCLIASALLLLGVGQTVAHSGPAMRRPISPSQPAWIIHIDVWNNADPQKIIDLVPEDIRPYAIFNISTSSDDKRSADGPGIYDSWMKVCAQNRVWAMIQCASGAYSRMPEDDIYAYERYFQDYPNFLGFNFAEQFWGFGDEGQPTFEERLQLFAKLLPVCHQYGGYLAVSFCDSYYSGDKMPLAYMKRNNELRQELTNDPDHFLCFEKFTLKKNFLEIESHCLGAWLGGYAGQYGIRYDQCGWLTNNDETDQTRGGSAFVTASGAIPIAEHVMLTGETILDGPELIREQCTYEASTSITLDGFTRRNWAVFPQFNNISADLFRKILDGTIRIPTRQEVIDRTKICIVNDLPVSDGSYAPYVTPETLYDGLYRSASDQGGSKNHWLDNRWWTKTTGRYPAIPMVYDLLDKPAQQLKKVKKSEYDTHWPTIEAKQTELNGLFPEEYTGDIYAGRLENGWVTYNPYQYDEALTDGYRICSAATKRATGTVPFKYNTCEAVTFDYAPYSLGVMKEFTDEVTLYLSNYQVKQSGNTATEADPVEDIITIKGASAEPNVTWQDRGDHSASNVSTTWADNVLTIKVTHNGPLDLTIGCKGNATDRATAYNTAKIEIPVIAPEYEGTLQYEAEHADYKDINTCRINAFNDGFTGHCGQGFVEMGDSKNATLRDTVTLIKSGTYDVAIRYQSDEDGSVKLYSNGHDALYLLPNTNGEWAEALNTITLAQGENAVVIQNAQRVNVKIDCIRLTYRGGEPTAIRNVAVGQQGEPEAYYDLNGHRLKTLRKGMNIVKGRDGKVRKVLYK